MLAWLIMVMERLKMLAAMLTFENEFIVGLSETVFVVCSDSIFYDSIH